MKNLSLKLWMDKKNEPLKKKRTKNQKLKYKLRLVNRQYKQSPDSTNIYICKNPGHSELEGKDRVSEHTHGDQHLFLAGAAHRLSWYKSPLCRAETQP